MADLEVARKLGYNFSGKAKPEEDTYIKPQELEVTDADIVKNKYDIARSLGYNFSSPQEPNTSSEEGASSPNPYHIPKLVGQSAAKSLMGIADFGQMVGPQGAINRLRPGTFPTPSSLVEKGIEKLGYEPESVLRSEKPQGFGEHALAEGTEFLAGNIIPGGGGLRAAKGVLPLAKTATKGLLKNFGLGTTTAALKESGTPDWAAPLAAPIINKGIGGIPKGIQNQFVKQMARNATPNVEAVESAKELGIKSMIPAVGQLDSPVTRLFSSPFFKKALVSKQYKDQFKNFNKEMADKFSQSVDQIHPEAISREGAHREFLRPHQEEYDALKKVIDKLYNVEIPGAIKDTDKIVPTHTLDAIEKLNKQLTRAASPSKLDNSVLERIMPIQREWGMDPSILKQFKGMNPKALKQMEEQSTKSVPLESVYAQLKAIRSDIRHKDLKGTQNLLHTIEEALEKDLSSSSNKNFVSKWKEADEIYKDLGTKFKNPVSKNLRGEESSKTVLDYMNDKHGIDQVSSMLKDVPEKEKILSGLKRAKYQEVVVDKVTNSDGTINYEKLAQMFLNKGKEAKYLESLNPEGHFYMKKLAQLNQPLFKSKKYLQDVKPHEAYHAGKIGPALAGPVGSALFHGMHAIMSPASLGWIATTTAGPYVISKIISNPKYVKQAYEYALAQKNGNVKRMDKITKNMENIFTKDINPHQYAPAFEESS